MCNKFVGCHERGHIRVRFTSLALRMSNISARGGPRSRWVFRGGRGCVVIGQYPYRFVCVFLRRVFLRRVFSIRNVRLRGKSWGMQGNGAGWTEYYVFPQIGRVLDWVCKSSYQLSFLKVSGLKSSYILCGYSGGEYFYFYFCLRIMHRVIVASGALPRASVNTVYRIDHSHRSYF